MRIHLLAIGSLWKRELIRFWRQKNRVIGALGPPVLIWLFIGSGFGASFQPPGSAGGSSYLQYFYPGVVTLVVLFTAIFSAISVIEDRRDGFLAGVLVTPVARPAIVLGKMLGGATQAFLEGVLLLLIAPLMGMPLSPDRVALALATLALVSLGVTALGCATAWGTDSTQGYHAIMNMLLMPMWVLSGAFFPLTGAPRWLQAIMYVNPMTYGLSALRSSLYGDETAHALTQMTLSGAATVLGAFSVVMFGAAVAVANRSRA